VTETPDDRLPPPPIEDRDPRRFVSIGGPVREFRLSLRVFGDDLDPDEVSALLGSPPTDSHRKGELRRGRHRLSWKRSAWFLTADWSTGTDKPLHEVIDEMLDVLTNDLAVWRALTDRYEVDLFCGVFLGRTGNEGFMLPTETMKRLVECGIEIGFDLYY
jgi:hypothetical protein